MAYGAGQVRGISSPSMVSASNKPKKMDTYPASILQGSQDYDMLMKKYQGVLNQGRDPGVARLMSQYQNLGTQDSKYQRGPDMASSMAGLKDLSATGGYSEQGINDLRARGISPIRSVYANAQQNITRQKALQGGYSPNYTASTAKMARELSEQIATQTSNVNAGIAENVAAGRRQLAPQYANAASNETNMMNTFNQKGVDNKLSAMNSLAGLYGQESNREMDALSGMRQTYGTTPANPALYGQQALQTAQLEEQKRGRKQAGGVALMSAYGRG